MNIRIRMVMILIVIPMMISIHEYYSVLDGEVYVDDFENAEVEECEDIVNNANDYESVDEMIEDGPAMRNNFMSDTTTGRLRGRDDEGKSSKDSYYNSSINESITYQMKAESTDYPESKGGPGVPRDLERKNSTESIGKPQIIEIITSVVASFVS